MSGLRRKHKQLLIRLMRVEYVHKTDIREQFWRLGVPVDVTFLFYHSETPRQPNARKLRKTFPNMKICLCGKDAHLEEIVINKNLPPSEWKLPDAVADDFIFEVQWDSRARDVSGLDGGVI